MTGSARVKEPDRFPVVSRGPSGPPPPRAPGSLRRTSTLDVTWPDGIPAPMQIAGRARDRVTPPDAGAPTVVSAAELSVSASIERRILAVSSDPVRPLLQDLVGARAGRGFRAALAAAAPEDLRTGGPLYLLLDDLAGASLVAPFAFSQWMSAESLVTAARARPAVSFEGVCVGFRPGSSGLREDGMPRPGQQVRAVEELGAGEDSAAWHELGDITGTSSRRARRIDIALTDVIEIDAFFQDSLTRPEGGRVAVHEYLLHVTADFADGVVRSVRADPRVLPYDECPLATLTVGAVVGVPLAELREVVPDRLRGTAGCTHLNDALRALADVPALLRHLPSGR